MAKEKSNLREAIDWIVSIVVAVIIALLIRNYVVELYKVDGPSMRPTLQNEERLVVNRFIYRFHPPQPGDIIVFKFPADPSRNFIKRVIAVPGDTVEIKDNKVYVNDVVQNEPYILSTTELGFPKSTVPPDTVFVLGDNRNNSEDSRFKDVGFVPYDMIKGKAELIFWPIDNFRSLANQ